MTKKSAKKIFDSLKVTSHVDSASTIWSPDLPNIKGLWKKFKKSETPTIMRNGTVILLYSKVPKHLACSDIPQY